MCPCALNYASDSDASRICQRGGGGGKRGVGRGFREIFDNSCMKTAFSCTLNAITVLGGGGRLCEEAYTSPQLPPFLSNPINGGGGGHGPLVPLSYANDCGAARICQRGDRPIRGGGGVTRPKCW